MFGFAEGEVNDPIYYECVASATLVSNGLIH